MEAVVFEIIMGIFFDAGMLAMVVHAAQHIGEDTGRVRFTAAVFAIGFFLGMIAKCVDGRRYIALAPVCARLCALVHGGRFHCAGKGARL